VARFSASAAAKVGHREAEPRQTHERTGEAESFTPKA
jgi:hypothetical protein